MTTGDLTAVMHRFDDAVMKRDRQTAEQVLDENYALVLVHPFTRGHITRPMDRGLEDYHVHSYSVAEQRVDESEGLAVSGTLVEIV